MDAERLEEIKKSFAGPMSEEEIEMLRDMQGFIDFSIRNGLAFMVVMSTLMHDIHEVATAGGRLEPALKRGFLPQVSGYSKYGEASVGEPEESVEAD